MGGDANYYNEPVQLSLTKESEYLVFIIGGGFTVGSIERVHTGNGLGYYVSGESVLTLEKKTAVVIISGY
jgi:hypothetical protein